MQGMYVYKNNKGPLQFSAQGLEHFEHKYPET
jgi:hypothetical protein